MAVTRVGLEPMIPGWRATTLTARPQLNTERLSNNDKIQTIKPYAYAKHTVYLKY
jgi:hypothetical protein